MVAVTAEMLRPLEFFAGLDDHRLAAICAIAEREDRVAGATVFSEGEPADRLRVVVSGRITLCARLIGRAEQCITTVTRGQVFGISAMTSASRWLASATAAGDSTLVAIDGVALDQLCQSDHELGYIIMRNAFAAVTHRLQDTRLQLLDMYGHD